MSAAEIYDRIGIDYASLRRADSRWVARIHQAFRGHRTLVNVGAGTGSLSLMVSQAEMVTTKPDAIMAVVTRNDHVLVIRRGAGVPGSGCWAPPSGKVEPGEDQAAAVVREVREEVALDVNPLRRVWACISDDGAYYLHWWLAEYVGGTLLLDAQ